MGPAPLRWALRAARKRMSVADLQELEEVKLLVVKGQATGVLTYAEVATALAEVELDEGDIEELHGYFEKSEIELVEDDPTHSAQEGGDRPQAGHDDRFPSAVPEGHRQGAPAHGPGGGRSRQAHRARRPRREAEDGRVEPAPGRLDRQELPQPGPALPRPDPGGHARPGPRR